MCLYQEYPVIRRISVQYQKLSCHVPKRLEYNFEITQVFFTIDPEDDKTVLDVRIDVTQGAFGLLLVSTQAGVCVLVLSRGGGPRPVNRINKVKNPSSNFILLELVCINKRYILACSSSLLA